jgi:hypothetical protein
MDSPDVEGVDRINEKRLDATGSMSLATRLHHVFGMDHFPNYATRWSLGEVEALEEDLQGLLQQVNQQKQALRQTVGAFVDYEPEFISPRFALSRVVDARLLRVLSLDPAMTIGR